MKDWILDDDEARATELGISVRKWRRYRRSFIEQGLLSAEVRPVEGPVLRFMHPEHLVAVGLMLGALR